MDLLNKLNQELIVEKLNNINTSGHLKPTDS
jgi:hypothetical protein